MRDGDEDRRSSEGRKHPPTRAYIEEEPDKRVETYQRWRQQQRQNRVSPSGQTDSPLPDTQHLSELERQIEAVQRSERESTLSAESEPAAATAVTAVKSKKKDKRSSLSSILSVFRGKKSRDSVPTPPLKKKKSSLGAMMEREGGASVLDPSAHKKIIEEPTNQRPGSEQPANEKPEPARAKSPYQLWRERRESSERQDATSGLQSELRLGPGALRTPTPDPDYDNLSYKSANSPRAPRDSPRAPREHPSFDDASSDASFEDYGRYTPRSNASEYGRNIPRYQPMPNLIIGYGRGRVSPATSEASMGHQAKRSPSTESFFGKNGAAVSSQGSSSQIWYQKYKHSSFSAAQQSSQSGGVFGDPLYGAFDGRISKFRGKIIIVSTRLPEISFSCLQISEWKTFTLKKICL